MKFPWTIVAFTAFNSLMAMPEGNILPIKEKNSTLWTSETETLVKERIAYLKLPFKVDYNPAVSFYVKRYLTNGRKATARIIGRSKLYFPIFEHELRLNNLPLELKFMPMVESDLKPQSYSPAGAAGLWQFIRPTGRLYGMKINRKTDERYDPYRATEAASHLLRALHTEYCDWALVLAAYNCGEVRLNKAIREGGSKDYDKIKHLLPGETRNYVARFVAAAYIAKYYDEHGIEPSRYKYNFNEIGTLKVFQATDFDQIEKITALDQQTIHLLNPSYLTGKVEASKRGNYIMLPELAIRRLKRYLRDSEHVEKSIAYAPMDAFEREHKVEIGQSVASLAERYGCFETEIMAWNGLSHPTLKAGQQLSLYFKPEVKSPYVA